MGKWGYDQDETFNIASGGLTLNFADNQRIANCPTVIQGFLYIDYTKGNETELQVRLEESFVDDDNPTTELYFQETIIDNAGLVELYTFKFTESGMYRIPFQLGESEDRIRVSARGEGTPAFSGEVNLYFGIR
jgi:hypothetical protein